MGSTDNPYLDRLLEAAHSVAEGFGTWLEVTRSAMEFFGSERGGFMCFDKQSGRMVTMETLEHDEKDLLGYANHYYQVDEATRLGFALPTGSWGNFVSADFRGEWGDFLHTCRIGHISALSVCNDDRYMAAVSMHMGRPRIWNLRQQREVQIYAQAVCAAYAKRRAKAEANLQMLNEVLHPGRESFYVVTPFASVLLAGPGGEAMLSGESLLFVANNTLSHRHPVWQQRLQRMIAKAAQSGHETLALPNGWGRAYRLTIRRLKSAANLGLSQAIGVRIERRDIFEVPTAQFLGELFALSPSEAALCHHLVAGNAIRECALLLDIAENTARKQLASIFRKTGCNRQAELIRLASGL